MERIDAREAARLIKDGDTLAVSGFLLATTPSELLREIGNRFLEEGHPRNMTLLQAAGTGNNGDEGIMEISHRGMVRRYLTGHFARNRRLAGQASKHEIEAYNFPQGVLSKMYRALSSGQKGVLTTIGLHTFVDPREGGGKLTNITTEDLVEVVTLGGEEYLYYKAQPVDVAIIRGTTADEQGNITMEEESGIVDAREIAMAAKACGGKVIVQVKYTADSKSLDRNRVVIPGIFVDYVVVATEPEKTHRQTVAEYYDPAIAGHTKRPVAKVKDAPLDERKIIARRAAMEIRPGDVVNLGYGMPEAVGHVAAEEGLSDSITLTLECGIIGGVPLGGANFGSALNAHAVMPMSQQFDFYNAGGLDVAFLGFAEVNGKGDINVSSFGGRFAGCGGFIDISQATKRIFFVGTLTTGGLVEHVEGGKLVIDKEGSRMKFIDALPQRTFNGAYALKQGHDITFITDRCVMKLTEESFLITEVAPGVDIEKDIAAHMAFPPKVAADVKKMDPRIFAPEKMHLA